MVEVINLTKKYNKNIAVDNISFKLEKGTIYGLLGPNGAGKSTTMNIITGCLNATSGTIIVEGHDINTEALEAKKLIGYLPEQPPLYVEMTPYEYLTFVAEAKGISSKERLVSIEHVMQVTQIEQVANRLIKNLSKGFKQRVGIAQAMLGNPEIIILDEPTVGLDPLQIIEIRELIKELGKKHTVILSSHILSEVSAVCDYIYIINKGKLVASDTPENLKKLNLTENIVTVTAKTSIDKMSDILNGITEIKSFKIGVSDTENCVDATITCSESEEIREVIFHAFADAGCPVFNLNLEKASLEDIFLKLTGGEN